MLLCLFVNFLLVCKVGLYCDVALNVHLYCALLVKGYLGCVNVMLVGKVLHFLIILVKFVILC